MTTANRPLTTALSGARFAGDWLPSCYTTLGDTTHASTYDANDWDQAIASLNLTNQVNP